MHRRTFIAALPAAALTAAGRAEAGVIAKPRRKIPEAEKPTPAMRRAQLANSKKAQAALRKRRRAKA